MRKERPILFSGEMVRAILAGAKTETRRIKRGGRSPYGQTGDRLWVRETWANINRKRVKPEIIYRAGDDPSDPSNDAPREFENDGGKWRPSIFMPRWASRILLGVVYVKVERLQDITEAGAEEEGVDGRKEFAALWDKINGKRGPWRSNPLVWVITFRRIPNKQEQD